MEDVIELLLLSILKHFQKKALKIHKIVGKRIILKPHLEEMYRTWKEGLLIKSGESKDN